MWLNPKFYSALAVALAFTFSEAILYFFNFVQAGSLTWLFVRLVLTAILHTTTALTILHFMRLGKWLIIPGLVTAILTHFLYNSYLIPLLITYLGQV